MNSNKVGRGEGSRGDIDSGVGVMKRLGDTILVLSKGGNSLLVILAVCDRVGCDVGGVDRLGDGLLAIFAKETSLLTTLSTGPLMAIFGLCLFSWGEPKSGSSGFRRLGTVLLETCNAC